jgi:hypothetical protein
MVIAAGGDPGSPKNSRDSFAAFALSLTDRRNKAINETLNWLDRYSA